MEVASTNYLLICAEDRAHYQCMLARLKRMRSHFSRRRSTIADSHALFDRIRVGPIASRRHWLKCKLHWFTSPESAKLYQAELEIKRRIGERPALKRWWKEEDQNGERSHLYRVQPIGDDLNLDDIPSGSVDVHDEQPQFMSKHDDYVINKDDLWALENSGNGDFGSSQDVPHMMNPLEADDLKAAAASESGFGDAGGAPGSKESQRTKSTASSEDSVTTSVDHEAQRSAFASMLSAGDISVESFSVIEKVDDIVVTNAYSVVREINEVCVDADQSSECTPKPGANATTSV